MGQGTLRVRSENMPAIPVQSSVVLVSNAELTDHLRFDLH